MNAFLLRFGLLACSALFLLCCTPKQSSTSLPDDFYLKVLGIAQDAGYPQAGCAKDCCKPAWANPNRRQLVSCLGVADPKTGNYWLFDATPDIKDQIRLMEKHLPKSVTPSLAGIFLTHGHIGHYTGLMQLGREVMGSKGIPVYVMPRMQQFLTENGPWSQLVKLGNIQLRPMQNGASVVLDESFTVIPFLVPHRDEFTETVGFEVHGPSQSMAFIPDIDKWGKWDQSVQKLVQRCDYAFLDGTFFQNGELPGRNMSEIPHPFVEESMALFDSLEDSEKSKVYFTHFNHTNPLLQVESQEAQLIQQRGYPLVYQGLALPL